MLSKTRFVFFCFSPSFLQGAGFYPMIGRVIPIASRDSKARTSVVTRSGDKVRIHPASVNSKLKVEKPELIDYYNDDDEELMARRRPPEFAALLFFDEITRGDSSLYIKSCTAMHPHPVMLVAAQVLPAPDTEMMDTSNQEERTEDSGAAAGVAVEVQNMQSMQLHEVPGASNNHDDGTISTVLPDTGLLVVDGWLKFRVPIQTIAQLSCLRLRVASAFAAKVNRPREDLPVKLQMAMDVSAGIFINESESGDGVETDLGCSYRNNGGGRSGGGRGYGGRGGGGGYNTRGGSSGGNHSHHLFRYSHHAPPVPNQSHSDGGFRGRGRGRGRGVAFEEDQGRSYEYRGPYAPPSTYSEYEDRHGMKRSHSGNPREHQSTGLGGGGGGGRGGGGRGGGRIYGRCSGTDYQHQGRGRGRGRGGRGGGVGGRGGGGRGGGGY